MDEKQLFIRQTNIKKYKKIGKHYKSEASVEKVTSQFINDDFSGKCKRNAKHLFSDKSLTKSNIIKIDTKNGAFINE